MRKTAAATSGAAATIDPESYEPAYVQLVNILRRKVAAGEYRPGARLPSEGQLCRTYAVSPMTVRRAVNVLLDQGVVTTSQGKGTFVKPMELSASAFGLENLLSLLKDKEKTAVKLIAVNVVAADERVGRKLGVSKGTRVIYIRRVLLSGGAPVLYHQEYLVADPARPIVEAEMEITSLQGLLAGTGETDFKGGVLTIEATALDEEEAKLLQGTPHQPAFRLAHTFYGFDDRPASWGWFICRGDQLRFQATVGMWGDV